MTSSNESPTPIPPLPTKEIAVRIRLQVRTDKFKIFQTSYEAILHDARIVHYRALALQKQQQVSLLSQHADLAAAMQNLETDSELKKVRSQIEDQQKALCVKLKELNRGFKRRMRAETEMDESDAGILRLESLLEALTTSNYGDLEKWGDLPLSGLEADVDTYEWADSALRQTRAAVTKAVMEASEIDLEVTLDGFVGVIPVVYRKDQRVVW
ncbi:hypothetical protein MBLNU230_g3121t1 [Neophaeotheca triangularis]